jgi:hypothetical protein
MLAADEAAPRFSRPRRSRVRLRSCSRASGASSEPLVNPWHLHLDGSLARSLGFRPIVRTVYQAAQEHLL